MAFYKAMGFIAAMVAVLVLGVVLLSKGAAAPFLAALAAGIFLFAKYGCLSQSGH